MISISELALHIKRGEHILRTVVSADFAKKILEENFNPELLQEALKTAKQVNHISGFGSGLILIDENEKKVISAQTAFKLDTLENLYEPWEYIEEGLYNLLKAIKP